MSQGVHATSFLFNLRNQTSWDVIYLANVAKLGTGPKSRRSQLNTLRLRCPRPARAPRSCSDTNDVTCCHSTGNSPSQLVATCRLLLSGFCRLLLPGFHNVHLWEHRWGVASPSIPASLLLPLALEGVPRRKGEQSVDEWSVWQRTLNLSLQHKQTLVSFSLRCTQWLC